MARFSILSAWRAGCQSVSRQSRAVWKAKASKFIVAHSCRRAELDRFDLALAIGEGALAGLALAHGVLVQRRSLDKLAQRFVAVFLARKQKIRFAGAHRFGQRPATKQGVAQTRLGVSQSFAPGASSASA